MSHSVTYKDQDKSDADLPQAPGFHAELEPSTLRRSLICSASASGFGATFFAIIQGTVFNFFLEDMGLKERLPFFMALWCIGSIGNLGGSWIQDRWQIRKELFLVMVGGSRLVWFAVALIPIFWPALYAPGPGFIWLTTITAFFYFTHSLGNTAWLSWMADLVPAHLQGKYWSLRQVGCSITSGTAVMLAGYYLEHSRNVTAYAVIFSLAALCGIIDACMFIFVAHRRPHPSRSKLSFSSAIGSHLKEPSFRRLCSVYLLCNVANWLMAPTAYFFMRERVGMDPYSISLATALSMAAYTVFSLLWGRYSDDNGHRGPLALCLILQAACNVFYFVAGRGDDYMPTLSMVIGQIGWCGVNLFMNPMLFHYTRGSISQSFGIAVFSVVVNLANFVALIGTDRYLYEGIGYWAGRTKHDVVVYFWVMAIATLLRVFAAILTMLLPAGNAETAPGTVIKDFVTTNPLRATFSALKYVVGHEPWESN